jgi:ankyrin repeat protein
VKHGAKINVQDKDGDTPLHGAASMGHAEVVTVLIRSDADLSKANNLGLTPIHQAENAGHRNVALAITNSRDPHTGKTPLFELVEELSMDPPPERVREIEDTVHDYIQCDADVNIEVDGSTPLLLAILHGYEDIAADLIKHGADVNHGHPLLAAAVEICNAGTPAAALDHTSSGPMPPSRWAFLHRTAALLVQYGADVNARLDGHSPLEMAMQGGCSEFAEMLLASNAQFCPSIFFESLKELQTPIPDARRHFIEEMSSTFIESGSMDLSSPMEDGNTPLELAIKGEQPEVALKLINAGCDININNPLNGILSVLKARGPKSPSGPVFQEAALAIIEKRPATLDEDVNGVSCMDLAIDLGLPDIAEGILDAGIDVNHHAYFTNGMKELAQIGVPQNEIEAERFEFLENVSMMLLDAGSGVNVIDEEGNSPMELAIEANSHAIVEQLLKPTEAARMQRVNVDKKNALGETVLIQCLKAMTEDDAMDDERYDFLEATALRLVDYGADHANALQFAVQASHEAMVDILMEKDVDLNVFIEDPVKRKFPDEQVVLSYFPNGHPEPEEKSHAEMEAIPEGAPWGHKIEEHDLGDGVVFCEAGPGKGAKLLWMMGRRRAPYPLLYSMMLELEDLILNQKSGERMEFLKKTAARFIEAGAKVKIFHDGRALLDVVINTDELQLTERVMDKLPNDIDLLDVATGSTVLYRLLTQRKMRIESGDHAMKVLVAQREDFVHDVASLLLSRGAELHVSGPHGSLFDCAIGCGSWEVCGLILEQSRMYGFCDAGDVPFLHKVIAALGSEFVAEAGDDAKAVVETMAINLVDRDCDVDQEWAGKQPLDVAASNGSVRLFTYLLDKGAHYSRTVIHTMLHELIETQAEQRKAEETITDAEELKKDVTRLQERIKFLVKATIKLIDHGTADVDVEVNGETPLTLAVQADEKMIIQQIIEKSHKLGYDSYLEGCMSGRQLLDSVVAELANEEHCSDEKMDYFKNVLPGLANRGWFVLQETMAACGHDNYQANEVVLHAINRGAKPAAPNPECMNETPLHAAAANGLKTIAVKLLELGAPVDAKNDVAETPLIKACLKGRINLIELLLQHGADVNARASGTFCNMGPLHIAAAIEMPAMVEVLLRQTGLDVNILGHYGRSALHEAFYTSQTHPEVSEELVYALLDAQANVNMQDVDGKTPLMLAARHGSMPLVRQMMERGADVTLTDNVGNAVYDYAVMGNQHAVYTFITRREPLPESNQKRVIMHAIRAGMNELLEELIEVGGGISVLKTHMGPHPVVINVTWDEPLWWAAYFGKADLVEKLLKAGVNVAVTDSHHRNLFHWCSMWGLPQHSKVLEVLCAAQSPAADATDLSGQTPYDVAVACGNAENAALLKSDHSSKGTMRKANSWAEAKQIAIEADQPYVDHEFDANLHSLCVSTELPSDINPRFSGVEWKRPNELIEDSKARLDLSHLSQVELGCCGNPWLLSSVLVGMETPYGLTTIFDVGSREIVNEGCYSFTFRFGGCEAKVLIDDRIPCLEGVPMYGGFGAGNNIAYMLVEKALAKLVGSFEGLQLGVSSDLFRVSDIGKALFEVVQPPEFVDDAELKELVQEVSKNACLLLLSSSCAMYGDHSSVETLTEITEFFTHEVEPAGMGVSQSQGQRHHWAAEPKRVLPGSGSCSCQEPVITIMVNVTSRVRVEVDTPESADNIRIYQTGADDPEHGPQPWNFIWRHAVPGSATEFDLMLQPSIYPYVLFFTQMGSESDTSKPVYFDLWSDKELIIQAVDNNEDLFQEISKLTS